MSHYSECVLLHLVIILASVYLRPVKRIHIIKQGFLKNFSEIGVTPALPSLVDGQG